MPFSPADDESMVAWILPTYLWALNSFTGFWGTEKQIDVSRKLCKYRVGRGALYQYLALHKWTEVRQGISERLWMCFIICTDFFAPGCGSRFLLWWIMWGLTQTLSRAPAETSWGADSSIPFATPAVSQFVVGGCCSLTLLPVVPPTLLWTPSNCSVKQNKTEQNPS